MIITRGSRRAGPGNGGAGGHDGFPVDSLAEMFELAPNFRTMLSGPEHRFVEANPAYLRLVGREAVVGRTVREVLPEIADQGFLEILDRVYETGEPFTATEMPVRLDVDGKVVERYVSFVYQPVHSADGPVCGIAVHGMDVTDHVRARRAVEEREAYYESLLAPPVVYMSGYAEEDALPADEFTGGDVLLEKPFTIQELLAVVGRAVRPRDQCGG